MNIVDVLSILVFVVFAFLGTRIGFLSYLESAVALFVSYISSYYLLQPLLKFLETFGLKENLFMPIIVFVFLLIVIWALLYSFTLLLFRKFEGKMPKWTGLFSGLVLALVFCNVMYVILFGVVGEGEIRSSSKICSFFTVQNPLNIFSMKPFLFREEVLDGKTIVTEEEKEVITISNLPDLASQSVAMEVEILARINSYRRENGLDAVEIDKDLSALALDYANEIIATKRFSHIDSDSDAPGDRAEGANVNFNYLGENLVIAPSLEEAHQGLLSSNSHRENILQPLFRRVGIAVLKLNSFSNVLVVEEFSN